MTRDLNRREAARRLAFGIALLPFAGAALRLDALASPSGKDLAERFLKANSLSRMLLSGELSQPEWQSEMNAAFLAVNIPELLGFIDFDRIARKTQYAEKGVNTAPLRLPLFENEQQVIYTKLFAVGKGRAIIPHGHQGMVSGHLVLKGAFHLRRYDRVSMEGESWLVRPLLDQLEVPGGFSTISDEQANVHWLIAEEDAWTLDFIMAPARKDMPWTIQNLDMDEARPAAGDLLEVPKLQVARALAKYG